MMCIGLGKNISKTPQLSIQNSPCTSGRSSHPAGIASHDARHSTLAPRSPSSLLIRVGASEVLVSQLLSSFILDLLPQASRSSRLQQTLQTRRVHAWPVASHVNSPANVAEKRTWYSAASAASGSPSSLIPCARPSCNSCSHPSPLNARSLPASGPAAKSVVHFWNHPPKAHCGTDTHSTTRPLRSSRIRGHHP